MAGPEEKTERIEALRGLLERLDAPDLTLAEAQSLRAQLDRLLARCGRKGQSDRAESVPIVPSGPWDDEPWPGGWSSGALIGTPV